MAPSKRLQTHPCSERGVALVVVLLTLLLLSAVGAALTLTTSAEGLTSLAFRSSLQAFYAVDAAAEWTAADLQASVPDWAELFAQSIRSRFVDGAPAGTRSLADGSLVDITAVLAAHPGWYPYAFGPIDTIVPASPRRSALYVIVLVAPDAGASDRIRVHAEAFGPRGAHRVVELRVSHSSTAAKIETWQEVR